MFQHQSQISSIPPCNRGVESSPLSQKGTSEGKVTAAFAKEFTDEALTELLEALEKGKSETLKRYLAAMARFHRYSWGNILLIYTQKPNATQVAGFHAWLKFHRHVRKGEKGILIFAPLIGRATKDEDGNTDEPARIFGFRKSYVFDISQTDGEPLPEFATARGETGQFTQRLKDLVIKNKIELVYSTDILPARGLSAGARITLLPDLAAAEEFVVLVHELAHEFLHKSSRRQGTTRTIRETEAEAVSFVVANGIGLDTNTSSSDYIQLHCGDKEILAQSLRVIQETATAILQAILPDRPPV